MNVKTLRNNAARHYSGTFHVPTEWFTQRPFKKHNNQKCNTFLVRKPEDNFQITCWQLHSGSFLKACLSCCRPLSRFKRTVWTNSKNLLNFSGYSSWAWISTNKWPVNLSKICEPLQPDSWHTMRSKGKSCRCLLFIDQCHQNR